MRHIGTGLKNEKKTEGKASTVRIKMRIEVHGLLTVFTLRPSTLTDRTLMRSSALILVPLCLLFLRTNSQAPKSGSNSPELCENLNEVVCGTNFAPHCFSCTSPTTFLIVLASYGLSYLVGTVGNWSLCYEKDGYYCMDFNFPSQCESFKCSTSNQIVWTLTMILPFGLTWIFRIE